MCVKLMVMHFWAGFDFGDIGRAATILLAQKTVCLLLERFEVSSRNCV